MPDYQPIDYRLRCHTKRTDLPADVLRDIGEAYAEIERLRNERNEARRDVCDMMHITGFLAGDYAASRGWDCFPDMKRNVSKEVENFRFIMERDYAAVVAQRDAARRELCAARRELCRDEAFIRLQRHRVHRDSEDVVGLAKEISVERGWDCFKENIDD